MDMSISKLRVSGLFLGLLLIIEIPVLNAKSVDPDQMPRSAASDLGLQCLQRSNLWDAGLKWVNNTSSIVGHFVSSLLAVLSGWKFQSGFWFQGFIPFCKFFSRHTQKYIHSSSSSQK